MNAKLQPAPLHKTERRSKQRPERAETTQRAEHIWLTPSFARQLLDGHVNYRPHNADRVKMYKGDIVGDKWRSNGDTIVVDENGQLIDGQHRCHAVIESGIPIQTWIIWGVPASGVDVKDLHRPRSMRHILTRTGYSKADILGPALPFVWTWEKSGTLSRDSLGHPSKMVLKECLQRNPDITRYVHDSKPLRELGLANSLTSALRYILTRSSTEEIANQFLGELGIGEMLAQTNPVFQLRKRLQKNLATGASTLKKRTKLAMISKAWNMWLAGQECTQLMWRSTGPGAEPFPKILTQQEVSDAEQAEGLN